MTLLGKIFTAMIFIASLVVLTLAVMVGASHKNWQVQAEANKKKYETLRISSDEAKNQQETLTKQLEREKIARAMAIQQLQIKAELRKLEVDAKEADLQAETQKSQDALARMESALDRLRELEGELTVLREENVNLRTELHAETAEVVTLTDANHQIESRLLNMNERYSQLTDEIAHLVKVMNAYGLDDGSLTAHIPPPIDARISRVSQTFDGMVEINVGSDDGIRKGHELDIYRGPEFLGRMRIIETNSNQSVGQLIDDLTRGPIREDDRVTTKLRG